MLNPKNYPIGSLLIHRICLLVLPICKCCLKKALTSYSSVSVLHFQILQLALPRWVLNFLRFLKWLKIWQSRLFLPLPRSRFRIVSYRIAVSRNLLNNWIRKVRACSRLVSQAVDPVLVSSENFETRNVVSVNHYSRMLTFPLRISQISLLTNSSSASCNGYLSFLLNLPENKKKLINLISNILNTG